MKQAPIPYTQSDLASAAKYRGHQIQLRCRPPLQTFESNLDRSLPSHVERKRLHSRDG